ncbi:amidohydrolase family protein [uncultured Cohaesibacter sp.]|uniref:dihydroorotase n=1 Tax=uncultured Cohaesibacter sp. TaxID=1002546 RepID=UPI0029C7A8AD|nr:amidohydrolase family protein [uncultured Cohaesibacter sp.]
MSDFDLVVTGRIVLLDQILENGFIAVRDGTIAMIGQGRPPAAKDRQDFGNGIVLPGAVDAQVHSLSQKGAEGFAASTRAAAAGGVTTIVDMPYDEGDLICSAAAVKRKAALAEDEARVDVALYGTILPDEGVMRIAEQAEAGVCAFKFSTFGTDPKRFPRIAPALLREAFDEVAKTGLVAGVHNEDDGYVSDAMAAVKAAGITDYRAHGLSRPQLAETLAMLQIYETGAETGCPAHVVHCSVARGYELARLYRANGHAATVECCIHYLVLSEEDDVARILGKAKCNPPVRGRAERDGIWHHLAAGNVSMVSTDHVSWSEDRKSDPEILKNASGMPGLEVMVPLFVKGALEHGVSLTMAARLMADNPAKHFRIDHRKGGLAVGRDADFTVLVDRAKTYDAKQSQHSVAGWSPYDGMTLPWTVAATWRRGELVFDGTEVLAAPGSGSFIRPPATLGLRGDLHS